MSILFSDQTSTKASLSRRLICLILANLVVLNFCIVQSYAQGSIEKKPSTSSVSDIATESKSDNLPKKNSNSEEDGAGSRLSKSSQATTNNYPSHSKLDSLLNGSNPNSNASIGTSTQEIKSKFDTGNY